MSSKTKTTAKTGDAKPALVPKLRFPEFRKADRWEEKRLGEVASFFKGKGISKAEIATNGRRPCIRYGELYTRYGEVIDKVFSRTDADDAELFFSRSNDVIIPGSGETKLDIAKASCVMHDDVALGGDLNVIRTKHNGVFLSYYFNGPKKRDIAMVAQGDTVVHLYPSQLEKLAIALPKEAEQQKIAECLSSVDGLIAAQARKLDALKTHKKGLMQQLFPREGETQPRQRFPEFQNAGFWANQLLADFIDEFREKSKTQDEHEVLTSARYGLVRQREYFDNDRITERDNIGFNVIPPNHITYRSRSDDRHFYFNENNMGIVGIISTYYPVFRIRSGSNKFFIELLSRFAALVGKRSVGTSQTVLSLNELRKIELPMPGSKEQQRIADCLTALDDLISAAIQELEALKAHKKGLMQQLFPCLEEST